MELLVWSVVGFLMILGIVQLAEYVLLFWNRPKLGVRRYTVVPLAGEIENMEQLLRYIRLIANWEDGESLILVLDQGMDDSSRELCRCFCLHYPEVRLLSPEEAANLALGKENV